MNDRIQMLNGNEEGYTAKEAMQHVVRYMEMKSAHAIEVFLLGDLKGDGAQRTLFVKMCMRFLHRNAKKVLLLGQNEEKLQELERYISTTYSGINVIETASWEEHAASYDMILNHINGAEAECVIAALSEEEQGGFLEEYRAALDAKIWLGLGTELKQKKTQFIWNKIRDCLKRQFCRKKI